MKPMRLENDGMRWGKSKLWRSDKSAPKEAFSKVSLAASLGWDCIPTVIHLANGSHTIDEHSLPDT